MYRTSTVDFTTLQWCNGFPYDPGSGGRSGTGDDQSATSVPGGFRSSGSESLFAALLTGVLSGSEESWWSSFLGLSMRMGMRSTWGRQKKISAHPPTGQEFFQTRKCRRLMLSYWAERSLNIIKILHSTWIFYMRCACTLTGLSAYERGQCFRTKLAPVRKYLLKRGLSVIAVFFLMEAVHRGLNILLQK